MSRRCSDMLTSSGRLNGIHALPGHGWSLPFTPSMVQYRHVSNVRKGERILEGDSCLLAEDTVHCYKQVFMEVVSI